MIHTKHETAERKGKTKPDNKAIKAILATATEFLYDSRPVLSLAFTVIFMFLILQITI